MKNRLNTKIINCLAKKHDPIVKKRTALIHQRRETNGIKTLRRIT